MKTIVAAVDFSSVSINAANYAADLACVIGTDLVLLHVYQPPLSYSEVPQVIENGRKLREDAEEKLAVLRADIINRIRDQVRVHAEIREGEVLQELDRFCSHLFPYAVVLGAENTGAFERAFLGRKTLSAIRQLSWPFIIIPPDVHFTNIRKIALACDFRDVVDTIPFMEIRQVVRQFNAEFHIVHASARDGNVFPDDMIAESEWLQEMFRELEPRYHFIADKDMEKGIVDFAEQNHIDLLVVIPKKHNLLMKVFHHSYTKKIVLHTHVPVMSIHE